MKAMVCVDVKLGCYKSYGIKDVIQSLEWIEFMFVSRDGKTSYEKQIVYRRHNVDVYTQDVIDSLEYALKEEHIIFLWDEGVKEKLRDIIKRRYG